MKKTRLRIKRVLLVVVLLLIIGVISTLIYYKSSLGKVSLSTADKEIVIKKGSSSKTIAKTLKKYSLIKNEFTFLVYIKLNNILNQNYEQTEDYPLPGISCEFGIKIKW